MYLFNIPYEYAVLASYRSDASHGVGRDIPNRVKRGGKRIATLSPSFHPHPSTTPSH